MDIYLIVVNNDGIEFQVKDFGIGIAKENLHKLTEPFYQADQTVTTKGFGLGLTICNKIIGSHNGKLRIESEKGKGSCFILHLPTN
jgi:signal transduction histidine kinase